MWDKIVKWLKQNIVQVVLWSVWVAVTLLLFISGNGTEKIGGAVLGVVGIVDAIAVLIALLKKK